MLDHRARRPHPPRHPGGPVRLPDPAREEGDRQLHRCEAHGAPPRQRGRSGDRRPLRREELAQLLRLEGQPLALHAQERGGPRPRPRRHDGLPRGAVGDLRRASGPDLQLQDEGHRLLRPDQPERPPGHARAHARQPRRCDRAQRSPQEGREEDHEPALREAQPEREQDQGLRHCEPAAAPPGRPLQFEDPDQTAHWRGELRRPRGLHHRSTRGKTHTRSSPRTARTRSRTSSSAAAPRHRVSGAAPRTWRRIPPRSRAPDSRRSPGTHQREHRARGGPDRLPPGPRRRAYFPYSKLGVGGGTSSPSTRER